MSPRIEEPLASAVREAGWTTLAPEADLTPVGPPVLRDSLHLGGDLWLVVVGAHDGSVRGVPVVHAEGKVRRAEPGDGAAQALVEVIRLGRATGAFTVTPWHVDPVVGETSLGERVLVGGAAVVRWADEADSRPAMDLMRRLVRSGFAGMPRPWGVLGWQPPAEVAPRLLAQVEAYVPGAVDGCDWAVHDLREALVADDLGGLHRSGTSLGELLAGFHLALASTAGPSTAEDVDRWRDAGQRDLDDALAATHSAYAPGSGEAYGLLRRREQQLRSLLALPEVVPGPPLMLTHGDLHVGRVLRAGHTLRITVDGAAADAPA
ncbi:MAG: hypothetical protein J2O46_00295, partial [Nocardioides sp.]|nr:hypothetical protein [Nocardioides sp.]